jgi:Fe2+ transport system protein B
MITGKQLIIAVLVFVICSLGCYVIVGFIENNFNYRDWTLFSRYFFTIFCVLIGVQLPKVSKEF